MNHSTHRERPCPPQRSPRFRLAARLAPALGLLLVMAAGDDARPSDGAGRFRGVCFVAGPPVRDRDFIELEELGVDWISQTPFGWQKRHDDPTFHMATDGHTYWGERDIGLRVTTRMARQRGIHTLLKPHIWLMDRSNGHWSGTIAMANEADWKSWFSAYETFIVHYATIAQEEGMEVLCIGTELEGTADREEDWRRIIAAVRAVYDGRLTYAANWSGEYRQVAFWDALDFIGIQAYFPLADKPNPSLDELVAAWSLHRDKLAELSRRTGKKIVFTEVGYRSSEGAAIEPWLWRTNDPTSHGEQARCYEATFVSLWDQPWFEGTFWWKWFPNWNSKRSARDRSFTPQGKDARAVLSRWYLGDGKGQNPGG